MKKQKPKAIAKMGRYVFYQKGNLFNAKVDDIWLFKWEEASESLPELINDLHEDQIIYERYYNEFNDRIKELLDTIEELKNGAYIDGEE